MAALLTLILALVSVLAPTAALHVAARFSGEEGGEGGTSRMVTDLADLDAEEEEVARAPPESAGRMGAGESSSLFIVVVVSAGSEGHLILSSFPSRQGCTALGFTPLLGWAFIPV